MKIYLDFDGVILDTEKILNEEYDGIVDRREFVKNYDWFKLMRDDIIINNSLDYIKESTCDISLLSKISSMCEGQAKIKYLREKDIFINIHLVPTLIDKNDVVNPKGNILIDDKIKNLDNWVKNGGTGIFFNKDLNNMDMYGNINTDYTIINDLSCLKNIEKVIKSD